MKFLFISCNDGVPWGGSEELWWRAAFELHSLGHEICVNVKKWTPRPQHIETLLGAGCDIVERTPWSVRRIVAEVTRRMRGKRPDLAEQTGQVATFTPDLVVLNQGWVFDGFAASSWCLKNKFPFVVVVQLATEIPGLNDRNVTRMREMYSSARRVYFVSRQNKTTVESLINQRLENSDLITNPYKAISPLPPYPKVDPSFQLAFVAALNPLHKGHPLLFEVLAQKRWKERNIQVNLYGTGPAAFAYKKQIQELGLTNVRLRGFENDLSKIWSENHALILCSRMEGQSLALIEAMYCARVSIVTNVGGAAELLKHGVNGFLAESPSVSAIDSALEDAWERRDEWESMGVIARKTLLTRIPPNPVADFYSRLLAESGKA